MPTPLLEIHPLLGIAAKAILLSVLTLGVASACRRRSAALVHGIWTIGLVGCLAIPLLTWLWPHWTLPVLSPPTATAAPTTSANPTSHAASSTANTPQHIADLHPLAVEPLAESTLAAAPAGPPAQRQTPTSANPPSKSPSLATWLFALWSAGSLVVLLRLAQQIVAMRSCVSQSSNVDDAAWLDLRDSAARRLGVRTIVALKLCPDALSPMVAGLFRPVVLLPADADRWSPQRRKLVLLHELAHVQRRDLMTQNLAALACAVYWFNPLVWWGASQMKRLREMACDDAVVSHSSVPATYAQTLLDIAKEYRCRHLSCTVAMARTNNVESRIGAILDATRSRAKLTKRTAFVIAASALIIAALVGSCQLVSRADEATKTEPKESAAKEKVAPRTMVVRVLDDQGQPLAGANIFANIVALEGSVRITNHDYTTDNQGRTDVTMPQRLEGMRLWISKQDFVPQFLGFEEGTHEHGRLIPDKYEFRLQKGHRLSGHVVDVDGNPIAGARVQVKVEVSEPIWGANPDPMISTWLAEDELASVTDAQGRWQITNAPPPREKTDYQFRLLITHPEYAGDDDWGGLQERQGITTSALRDGTATVTLSAGTAVQGRITEPDGKPVTKGLVVWTDRPYWATGVNETQIDTSGRYMTRHFPPGKYPITVIAPGFAPLRKIIDVSQNLGDVDIQLEPGNPIRIKIVDQAGNPIPKAGVGIGRWRGTEAIYNEKHPNVPYSGIPRGTNADGVYEWTWAPADAVEYHIGATGYAEKYVTLVAKPEAHQVQLVPAITIHGKVVDARSGKPIERFQVIPVTELRPGYYSTDYQAVNVAEGKDGQYELQLNTHGQTGRRYRVRVEAQGYRTSLGRGTLTVGDPPLEEDFQLEPAPAQVGEVLDADGKPADGFTVAVATPTMSPDFSVDRTNSNFGQAFPVRGTNRFELSATFEPQRIRVFNRTGFAEALRKPDEPIGTLRLQPWTAVSGRLMQGDTPIGNEGVYFDSLVRPRQSEARFEDGFYTKTDSNGHFHFDQLPPMSGTLKAYLGPWQDSPLTSSQSVPLQLKPGDHQEISLGGKGATISGRVVATGRNNDSFSKNWSLNYLVSRALGVDYPAEAEPLSFDPSGPLQPAWLRQPDFHSWLATRVNHFVKLSDDGRLRIHGVKPGEYDLAIRLYEQPAGCLVETIGEKIVPITISADQAAAGEVNIGDIEVECRIGPRVGADMRAFEFTDSSGQFRHINDMTGRYVLFHVWAISCAPCLESMPAVKSAVEKYPDKPLTVVGLNVDKDASAAKTMAENQNWLWTHNYLGDDSDLMRQLAVSSVPAYYLIGPDGKLVGSANQWQEIEKLLTAELK